MENKQTAVDFLKDKFIMIQWLLVRDEISRKKADEFLNEWTDKAKALEKEQIKDAFEAGIGLDKIIDDCDSIFEIFYEETYGK